MRREGGMLFCPGEEVRQQEVRRRQQGAAGPGSSGGRVALHALPGQNQRQQGLELHRGRLHAQGAKLSMSHQQKMSLGKNVHHRPRVQPPGVTWN